MQPSSESVWGLLFLRLLVEARLRGLGCELKESVLCSRCESSHGLAVDVFTVASKGLGVPLTVAIDGQDFLFNATAYVGGAQGEDTLDTTLEIARHPIGAAHEEDGLCFGVLKAEQSAVFEEATEEAADADVVTLTGDTRLEAADTADHKLDADTRLRGFVKCVDDLRVHEAVDLGEDRRGLAGFGVRGLSLDEFHDASR